MASNTLAFESGKVQNLGIKDILINRLGTGMCSKAGILNKNVAISMVSESGSPIKKIVTVIYLEVIADAKGEIEAKICSFSIWYFAWCVLFTHFGMKLFERVFRITGVVTW